jgi:hypothetical protein
MPSGPQEMLHLTLGESSSASLRCSLPRQDHAVLATRDTLCYGPAPAAHLMDQFSRVRAEHWAEAHLAGWRARARKIEADFLEWNRALARYRNFREVVLWCSSLAPCQLFLIQMLAWFADRDLGSCKLSIVDSVYAGTLPRDKVDAALRSRRRVAAIHFRTATRAWRAFTAEEPSQLNRLLAADLSALPHLNAALFAEAREYPALGCGLSAMERLFLEELSCHGPAMPCTLLSNPLDARWQGIGDVYLLGKVRGFIDAPNQLACFAEPFNGNFDNFEFNGSVLEITEFGRRVLAEQADAVLYNGVNRWIGGVRLEGQDCPWRWSEQERRVVRIS